jgi:hypothetical protein
MFLAAWRGSKSLDRLHKRRNFIAPEHDHAVRPTGTERPQRLQHRKYSETSGTYASWVTLTHEAINDG